MKRSRIIVMLCTIILFTFSFSAINTYDVQKSGQACADNAQIENHSPEGNGSVSPVLETDHYQFDDTININFEVISRYQKINHSYETEGFDIISVSDSNANTVNVKLSHISSFENAKFYLHVEVSNGTTIVSHIYAYKTSHGLFISPSSSDDSKERAYSYMVDNNFMTVAERETARQVNYQRCVTQILPQHTPSYTPSSSNVVSGHMTWKDDSGNTHPLQFIKIVIKNAGSGAIIGTVYTDVNGYYETSLQIPGGYFHADIYPGGLLTDTGDNIKIIRNNGYPYFYYTSFPIACSTPFTLEFDMSADLGKAFQIGQAAITAARYAYEMSGSYLTDVEIIYPYPSPGCFYSGGILGQGNGTIRIGDSHEEFNGLENYSSWDTIMHEYGHHVQYQPGMDIYGSSYGNNEHRVVPNLIDHHGYSKDHGIRLAWREAWPNIFASMGQQCFIEKGELDSNIASVGDAKYESYNGANWDYVNYSYETPSGTYNEYNGEASESGIMSVLWRVYTDFIQGQDNENKHKNFWDLITGNQVYTFSDFAKLCYAQFPDRISELGELMARSAMSPSSFTLTNTPDQSIPPSFSWVGNGGGTGTATKNDKFDIVFYDGNNSKIFKAAGINTTTYTLPQQDWDTALSLGGYKMKVYVMAHQTITPSTGGYYSQAMILSNPWFEFSIISYAAVSIKANQEATFTGDIVIPSTTVINGITYQVTEIADHGFENQTNITSITFEPSPPMPPWELFPTYSLRSIGDSSFFGCTGLTRVILPTTLISIGDSAFSGCTNLTDLNFLNPNSLGSWLKSIGNNAFFGCSSLLALNLPNCVDFEGIGNYAFAGCSSLTTVDIFGYGPLSGLGRSGLSIGD